MEGLNTRAKLGVRFVADMKAVSYLHLAQYLAPNYEPATETSPAGEEEQPGYSIEKRYTSRRGGPRRNAPWPTDRRLRLKAVSRLVHEWEDMGLVQTERPWSDQPKWVWATMAGLCRLGLTYNDAHFPEAEEELEHLYQITRVRLLVGRRPQESGAAWFAHSWVSERAIKSGYPQNTAGVVLPHLPDGAMELDEDAPVRMASGELLSFRRGDRLAVEVERTRKDFARLEAILPDLLAHYRGVWYFCSPKAADAVLATKERLVRAGALTIDQAQLIRVLDLAEE
jgi:hypothetical protein